MCSFKYRAVPADAAVIQNSLRDAVRQSPPYLHARPSGSPPVHFQQHCKDRADNASRRELGPIGQSCLLRAHRSRILFRLFTFPLPFNLRLGRREILIGAPCGRSILVRRICFPRFIIHLFCVHLRVGHCALVERFKHSRLRFWR